MIWFIVCFVVFYFTSVFFDIKHDEIRKGNPNAKNLKSLRFACGLSYAAWISMLAILLIVNMIN